MVCSYDGEQHQVVLADGRVVPIERHMCTRTATIMAPWALVTIRLALAVMPGEDYLLILGSETQREKLDIDVMKQLSDMAAVSGGSTSSTEQAFSEVPAMPPEVTSVRCVGVPIEAIQQAVNTEMEAVGEAAGFKDALLDRGPNMMIGFGDSEMQQREQALENGILRAAQGDMPPGKVAELRRLVLDHVKETFRRELKRQPPVQFEPMPVVWTPTGDICEGGDGATEGGYISDGCGLPGDELSSWKRSVAASALGEGVGFLRGDDILSDD